MPIRKRNLSPVLVRENCTYPVCTIMGGNELINENQEACDNQISLDTNTSITEINNKEPNIILFKKLNKKQSEVTTNTLAFGFSCVGTTIGIGLLLTGLGLKDLTVNQATLLELIGAGLVSFSLVKSVKSLVRISCPLDDKPPLIADDEPVAILDEYHEEDKPKTLELKKD